MIGKIAARVALFGSGLVLSLAVGCGDPPRARHAGGASDDAACRTGDAAACEAIALSYASGLLKMEDDATMDYPRVHGAALRACSLGSKNGCKLLVDITSYRSSQSCQHGTLDHCLEAVRDQRSHCEKSIGDSCRFLDVGERAAGIRVCKERDLAACEAACDERFGMACEAAFTARAGEERFDYGRALHASARFCETAKKDSCSGVHDLAVAACQSKASLQHCMRIDLAVREACRAGTADECAFHDQLGAVAARRVCTEGSVAECTAACDGGLGAACVALARLHQQGDRVPKNPALALGLFERACDQGDAEACKAAARELRMDCPPNIRVCIHGPRILPVDEARAAKYLDAVCTKGDFDACTTLLEMDSSREYALPHDLRGRTFALLTKTCSGPASAATSSEATRRQNACRILADKNTAAPRESQVAAMRVLCAGIKVQRSDHALVYGKEPDMCGRLRDLGEQP